MGRMIEQRLQQFHSRAVEQTRRAGLSAYLLTEDGSVVRIWPDGRRLYIPPGSTSRTSRAGPPNATCTVGQSL